jgi:hypothetical protein
MTAMTEQLVSIIHNRCEGEAFKYVGPVNSGDAVVAERVRDYAPGHSAEPGADAICKSCGEVVAVSDLRVGPEVANDGA